MLSNSEKLFEQAIAIKNDVTSRLVPNVLNNVILVSASLIAILVTLSNPSTNNICLFRFLLGTLLGAIFFGILCYISITIDFYTLGTKASDEAIKSATDRREPKAYLRSGKIFYHLIVWTFVLALLSFLVALALLSLYAWDFKVK